MAEYEKHLTEEEAETLYTLLGKLDDEMNARLGSNGFDTGEAEFTTIIRNKRRKYLHTVYGVGDE
jgi:hypothetical protein